MLASSSQLQMLYDYGLKQSLTSRSISTWVHGSESDMFMLSKFLEDNHIISGHFPVSRYQRLFPVSNIMSCVRDPLERVVSNYNHLVAHQSLEVPFEEYFRQGSSLNLQRRMLGPIPVSLLGWLCTTNNLADSLESLCDFVGTGLSMRHENRTATTRAIRLDDLSEDTKKEIYRLNKEDWQLYSEAEHLNVARNRFSELHSPSLWVNYHVTLDHAKVLSGCVFRRKYDSPIKLEVLLDEQVIRECDASEEFNGFARFTMPRKRYIGFKIPINNTVKGKLSLRVAGTHQELFTQLLD